MARKVSNVTVPRRVLTVFLALAFVFALEASASATLQLADPAFNGKVGYSTDGLGQDGTGGSVQAAVPPGSTVVKAYLHATYFESNPDLASRTINFDGTNVVTQLTPTQTGVSFLGMTFADVISQVATKVGTGSVTLFDFVIGNDPSSLDGVSLTVVYSNPTLPDGTVAVLHGGSTQSGDTATFNFASTLDPTVPGFVATMAIGSGFSCCQPGHSGGGSQFSTIDVNAQALSRSAGNSDDGFASNGGLITVGGVGDSTNNPTPPDQAADDDELYNLVPFLTKGDTQLKIDTSNPSNDDNLFLAVIGITAQASVTTEICDDGIDNDNDGKIDKDDPDCQPREICNDGIDNDDDGKIDGDDPDCARTPITLLSKSRVVPVRVSCAASARRSCVGKVSLRAASRRIAKKALGARGYRIRGGRSKFVNVRVSKRNARLIRRHRRLSVRAVARDRKAVPGTANPRVTNLTLRAAR